MGSCIIKVAPDEDLYMVWSSNVDNCTHLGTRKQITKYLRKEHGRSYENEITGMFERADESGTSDRIFRHGGWDDEEVIVHNLRHLDRGCGMLAREHFSAYANLILHDEEAAAEALTTPIEGF